MVHHGVVTSLSYWFYVESIEKRWNFRHKLAHRVHLKGPTKPKGLCLKKLARGVSVESVSDGYLALAARLATVERGSSEAPFFISAMPCYSGPPLD